MFTTKTPRSAHTFSAKTPAKTPLHHNGKKPAPEAKIASILS
jgi:hypothetical protein